MITPPAIPGHEIPVVPFPPSTGAMDATWQLAFNVNLWIVSAIFIAFALRTWQRTGSPLPLMLLVGGGLCVFMEPIVDVMGLCWFWRDGNWTMFEVFGRPIPTWILPTYIFYLGGQTLYTMNRLEKGETARGIWRLWGIYILVNVVLEEPPLHLGLYTYYGDAQPLQPGLLPLWWTAVNAAMPIVAGAIVYRLKPALTGWKVLLAALLVPMADGATNAAAGWPVWTALNSTDQAWITNLCAAATCGLAAVLIWVVTVAAATDSVVAPARTPVPAPGRPAGVAA